MARNSGGLDRVIEELASLKNSVADMAREGASAASDSIRSAATDAGAMAAEKSEEAVHALRGTIRAHPLVSIASAFSFGISIARMLRR
jgi:ElaB/YqjD/DUF883 family membrane-anchored ribosome-binding protein